MNEFTLNVVACWFSISSDMASGSDQPVLITAIRMSNTTGNPGYLQCLLEIV